MASGVLKTLLGRVVIVTLSLIVAISNINVVAWAQVTHNAWAGTHHSTWTPHESSNWAQTHSTWAQPHSTWTQTHSTWTSPQHHNTWTPSGSSNNIQGAHHSSWMPSNLNLNSVHDSVISAVSGHITVGGQVININPGTRLTPAEAVALTQVIDTGSQSIILSALGKAIGGTVSLNLVDSSSGLSQTTNFSTSIHNLVIPTGVSVLDNFGTLSTLSLTGNLVNHGEFYAYSTNQSITSGTISALNIINTQNALISSSLPSSLSISGAISNFSLSLNAISNIINAGTINSSGSLTLAAGGAITNAGSAVLQAANNINISSPQTIVNSGLIAATNGNINFSSGQLVADMTIDNTGGVLQALNGAINFRDPSFNGNANLLVTGGELLSQAVNINEGQGGVTFNNVGNITGTINVTAGEASFNTNSQNFLVGNWQISGDPIVVQSGAITISGSVTGGPVIYVSGGSITADSGSSINTSGGNVIMVAGADGTYSGGAVTVSGRSGAGGDINLTNLTSFTTSSSSGSGGDITLVAFASSAGSSTGGQIQLPAVAIQTGGSGSNSNGNVTLVAEAASGTGISQSGGNINTSGGASGTGNITAQTATPMSGSSSVVIDAGTGNISSGSFLGSSGGVQSSDILLGGITTNAATATALGGGNITVSATGAYNLGTTNFSLTTVGNSNALHIIESSNGTLTMGTGSIQSTGGNTLEIVSGNGQALYVPSANITADGLVYIDAGGVTNANGTLYITATGTIQIQGNGAFSFGGDTVEQLYNIGIQLAGNTIVFGNSLLGTRTIDATGTGIELVALSSLPDLNQTNLNISSTGGGVVIYSFNTISNTGGSSSASINVTVPSGNYYPLQIEATNNLNIQNVSVSGGTMNLISDYGSVNVSGTISSTSTNPSVTGGISIFSGYACSSCSATSINIASGTSINASGGDVVLTNYWADSSLTAINIGANATISSSGSFVNGQVWGGSVIVSANSIPSPAFDTTVTSYRTDGGAATTSQGIGNIMINGVLTTGAPTYSVSFSSGILEALHNGFIQIDTAGVSNSISFAGTATANGGGIYISPVQSAYANEIVIASGVSLTGYVPYNYVASSSSPITQSGTLPNAPVLVSMTINQQGNINPVIISTDKTPPPTSLPPPVSGMSTYPMIVSLPDSSPVMVGSSSSSNSSEGSVISEGEIDNSNAIASSEISSVQQSSNQLSNNQAKNNPNQLYNQYFVSSSACTQFYFRSLRDSEIKGQAGTAFEVDENKTLVLKDGRMAIGAGEAGVNLRTSANMFVNLKPYTIAIIDGRNEKPFRVLVMDSASKSNAASIAVNGQHVASLEAGQEAVITQGDVSDEDLIPVDGTPRQPIEGQLLKLADGQVYKNTVSIDKVLKKDPLFNCCFGVDTISKNPRVLAMAAKQCHFGWMVKKLYDEYGPDLIPAQANQAEHQAKYSPGEQAEYKAGEQAWHHTPGEQAQHKPGEQAQHKPGEQAQHKPGEQAQHKPGEQAQHKPGEQAQRKPGEQARHHNPGEQAQQTGRISLNDEIFEMPQTEGIIPISYVAPSKDSTQTIFNLSETTKPGKYFYKSPEHWLLVSRLPAISPRGTLVDTKSVFEKVEAQHLKLSSGCILIKDSNDYLVETNQGSIYVGKGSVAIIEANNNMTRVFDLHGYQANNIRIVVNKSTVNLIPGREAVIADGSEKQLNFQKLIAADGLGRRRMKVIPIDKDKQAVLDEFSVIDVMMRHSLVLKFRASKEISDQKLFAQMVKTAAAIAIVWDKQREPYSVTDQP